MVSVLISWLISALIIWLLARPFITNNVPFMNVTLDGWVAVVIVALVVGLISAFIVPLVKNLFKKANALVFLIISLIIDALALLLAAWLVSGFGIDFISALIVAAILSLVNAGFGATSKK